MGSAPQWCDFPALKDFVSDRFELDINSDHGISHWQRVEKNAIRLAEASGEDPFPGRLFAWLHDSCRVEEITDPEHGLRAARLAGELRGKLFDMGDEDFSVLCEAISEHELGKVSSHPIIGLCWDADRLDLPRVGISPSPSYMSTEAGRDTCLYGFASDLDFPE